MAAGEEEARVSSSCGEGLGGAAGRTEVVSAGPAVQLYELQVGRDVVGGRSREGRLAVIEPGGPLGCGQDWVSSVHAGAQ